MKDNKGVTLIEIIIVIAISAVLASSVIGGLRYIQYANSKSCANELNAMLEKVRVISMSRTNQNYLYIYQYDNKYYTKISNSIVADSAASFGENGTLIANNQLKLSYTTSSSPGSEVLIDGAGIYVEFARDTGGFKANPGVDLADTSDDYYYNEIYLRDYNGTLRYTITLVSVTGKHYVNKN